MLPLSRARSTNGYSKKRSLSLTPRSDYTSWRTEKLQLKKEVLELRHYKKQFLKYSKDIKKFERVKRELEKQKIEWGNIRRRGQQEVFDRMRDEVVTVVRKMQELEEVERRNEEHVKKIEKNKDAMASRRTFLKQEEERMTRMRLEFRQEYESLVKYKTMFAEKLEKLETMETSQQRWKEEQEKLAHSIVEEERSLLENEKQELLKIASSIKTEKERVEEEKAALAERQAEFSGCRGSGTAGEEELQQEISQLKAERESLEAQRTLIETRNADLEQENTELQSQLNALHKKISWGDTPRYPSTSTSEAGEVFAMKREIKGLKRQLDGMRAMYEKQIENLERQREADVATLKAEPDRTRNKYRKPGTAPNPRLETFSNNLRNNVSDFEHKRTQIQEEMTVLELKKKENEQLESWLRTYEKELNEEYIKRRIHKLTDFETAKIKYDMEKTRKKLEKREQVVSNRELELLSKEVVVDDIAVELSDVREKLEAQKKDFSLAKALLEKENIIWDNLEFHVEDDDPDE